MLKVDFEDRTYTITKIEEVPEPMKSIIEKAGKDGKVYYGENKPTGRQRITKLAIFYRFKESGNFQSIL